MSKIMFLGAGKMAGAIAGGVVKSGLFPADDFTACDVSEESGKIFTQLTRVNCVNKDFPAVAAKAQCIFVAVKPQHLTAALSPLRSSLKDQLLISIVAGVPIARLAELTGLKRIVRVMPNTPALVGSGAAAYSPSPDATESDCALVKQLLGAVGTAVQLPEKDLNAVTGLSGSGPAYVFEFIKALSDGGVAMGLTRKAATMLAAQTVMGAAKMVLESGIHPGELIDQVTSPGGTTIKGMEALADRAFAGAVMAAVRAATERSAELAKL